MKMKLATIAAATMLPLAAAAQAGAGAIINGVPWYDDRDSVVSAHGANIVADVIIPLSAQVPGLLAEGGVFLCSGIIDTRSAEVQAAIESRGMKIIRRWEKNGWVALAASL